MEHYDVKNKDYTKYFKAIRKIIQRFDEVICEKANKLTMDTFTKEMELKIAERIESITTELSEQS